MLIQEKDTYKIIGICMEVHSELGYGFSEIVYKDAIEMEAAFNKLPIQREKKYIITYKGKILGYAYFADFVMFDNIIVEIKSCRDGIAKEHVSQTLNYLRASGCKVGLIINFGKESLEYKRIVS